MKSSNNRVKASLFLIVGHLAQPMQALATAERVVLAIAYKLMQEIV
jgi:hypothetical protein